jgi:hypothetical protein
MFNERSISVSPSMAAPGATRSSGRDPKIVFHKKMTDLNASITELSADEIISTTTTAGFDAKNQASLFHETTNHLGEGLMPAGQNVVSLDSHVVWRAWSGTGANATAFQQASSAAYLWVIDPN